MPTTSAPSVSQRDTRTMRKRVRKAVTSRAHTGPSLTGSHGKTLRFVKPMFFLEPRRHTLPVSTLAEPKSSQSRFACLAVLLSVDHKWCVFNSCRYDSTLDRGAIAQRQSTFICWLRPPTQPCLCRIVCARRESVIGSLRHTHHCSAARDLTYLLTKICTEQWNFQPNLNSFTGQARFHQRHGTILGTAEW